MQWRSGYQKPIPLCPFNYRLSSHGTQVGQMMFYVCTWLCVLCVSTYVRGLDTKPWYLVFMGILIHFFDVNFLVTFYFDVSRISSIPCTLHLDSPIVSLHLSYICFIILLSSFSSPSTSPPLQHVRMRVCTHAHTHACLLLVL